MGSGEALFKIDKGNISEIMSMSNKVFYIAMDNGSEETMIIKGRFRDISAADRQTAN